MILLIFTLPFFLLWEFNLHVHLKRTVVWIDNTKGFKIKISYLSTNGSFTLSIESWWLYWQSKRSICTHSKFLLHAYEAKSNHKSLHHYFIDTRLGFLDLATAVWALHRSCTFAVKEYYPKKKQISDAKTLCSKYGSQECLRSSQNQLPQKSALLRKCKSFLIADMVTKTRSFSQHCSWVQLLFRIRLQNFQVSFHARFESYFW